MCNCPIKKYYQAVEEVLGTDGLPFQQLLSPKPHTKRSEAEKDVAFYKRQVPNGRAWIEESIQQHDHDIGRCIPVMFVPVAA